MSVLAFSGDTEETPPREEWHQPGVRTVRRAGCCQPHVFGVGHTVAMNGKIYRRDTSGHVRAVKSCNLIWRSES